MTHKTIDGVEIRSYSPKQIHSESRDKFLTFATLGLLIVAFIVMGEVDGAVNKFIETAGTFIANHN